MTHPKSSESIMNLLVKLCEDKTLLTIMYSIQINDYSNFIQYLSIRLPTAKTQIQISYLQLFQYFINATYFKDVLHFSIPNIVFSLFNSLKITQSDWKLVKECLNCFKKLLELPQTCGMVLYRNIEQKLIQILFSIYGLKSDDEKDVFSSCIDYLLTLSSLHPYHLPSLLPMIQLIPFSRIPYNTIPSCLTLLLQVTTINPSYSSIIFPALNNLVHPSATQILSKLISTSTAIKPLKEMNAFFTTAVLKKFIK